MDQGAVGDNTGFHNQILSLQLPDDQIHRDHIQTTFPKMLTEAMDRSVNLNTIIIG